MKKRTLIFIFSAMVLLPINIFAETGLGAAFSYGLGTGTGAGALSMSTPAIPGTVQNISLRFSKDYFAIGLTDDWWVIQQPLVEHYLDLYIGIGFYTNFGTKGGEIDWGLGGRIPVGLSYKPIDFFELFIEVVPTMGIGFDPNFYFPAWDVSGALGFRFWF